ncbi:WXG100 family type VII secretion target [Kitasatospora sp. NBC_01539]|uniref:WXG100 family type VII secretion target n=1 Tax=Kitasatospora sp. NBC_01539 TaxID=2903577 RepID=UPI0038602701
MTEKRFVRRLYQDGDFGANTHEDLVAMVDGADPVAVMQIGQRLLLAAQKMDEVSNELHAHMGGLDWQGDAADSFKNWGGNVSKSTMELASYSRTAGTYMATAGETLSEVKSGMPGVPTDDMEIVRRYEAQPNTAVTVGGFIAGGMALPGIGTVVGGWAAGKVADMVDSDWVTPEEANAAQTRINQAHADATQQMAKLGQSYDQSISRLSQAQPPIFPPPPGADISRGGSENVSVGGGSTGGGTGGSFSPAQMPSWSPPSGSQQVPTGSTHPTPVTPGQVTPLPNVGVNIPSTGIDHVPASPTLPSPSGPGLPGGGVGGGGLGTGGGLGGGGGGVGGLPGGTIPGGLGGGLGGGRGGAGGLGGGRGAGSTTGAGGAGRAGGSVTGAGGAGAGARAGGTAGAAGAAGGAQAGRSGAPGMGGMPHAGGAGGAGAKGGAGGARGGAGGLVGRSGGAVGGRRGPSAGGEFTQGGTGLRGRAERGTDGRAGHGGMGAGHGGAAGRKDKNRGNRPDYLTEDEDTWTSGGGPVNPGVIE